MWENWRHFLYLHARESFRQPDEALELPRGGGHRLVPDPLLPHLNVPPDQLLTRWVGQLRVAVFAGIGHVSRQRRDVVHSSHFVR